MSTAVITANGRLPEYFTPAEARALFRVSQNTLNRWDTEGRITSVRTPGGHRRFPSGQPAFAEVLAYIRQDGGAQ